MPMLCDTDVCDRTHLEDFANFSLSLKIVFNVIMQPLSIPLKKTSSYFTSFDSTANQGRMISDPRSYVTKLT